MQNQEHLEAAIKIGACIIASSLATPYADPCALNESARELYKLVTERHWETGWHKRDDYRTPYEIAGISEEEWVSAQRDGNEI